jgi:hypothetical protein
MAVQTEHEPRVKDQPVEAASSADYKPTPEEEKAVKLGHRLLRIAKKARSNYDTRWLQYYMASGSSNIFIVNELKLEEKKDEQKGTKAGFKLSDFAGHSGKDQKKDSKKLSLHQLFLKQLHILI